MNSLISTTGHAPSALGRGDWKSTLGRIGLVGKGVLFAVIGLLALQLASGDDGADATELGAIELVAGQPFGKVLLVALTASLFALSAWRFLEVAVGDPVEGSEPSDRVIYAAKGAAYLVLAVGALVATVSRWDGSGATADGGEADSQATDTVLGLPGGRWIVAAVGLAVIAIAGYIVKKHVIDQEYLRRMSIGASSWIAGFGRFGYAARAVAYALVGWFLVQAGLTYDASRARGLSGALSELSGKGWGQLVLWAVAFGLLAYGLFTLAEARYRRAA